MVGKCSIIGPFGRGRCYNEWRQSWCGDSSGECNIIMARPYWEGGGGVLWGLQVNTIQNYLFWS